MRNLLPTLVVLCLLVAAGAIGWMAARMLSSPLEGPARVTVPAVVSEAPSSGAEPRSASDAPPAAASDPAYDANERGIAALEAGELERAISEFEVSHAEEPDVDVYRNNLAEALARRAVELEREGAAPERALALELMERAAMLAPDREVLGRLSGRWRESARAEDGFERLLSEHFELAYDLNRDQVRAEVAQMSDHLETAYGSFGELFGTWPVEAGEPRIRVVLYTRAEFGAVTGLGEWAGGVFDGTIRVPVADLRGELPRVARVLRHELLHAFVSVVGGRDVPGWLNEGLAQLVETESTSARADAVERARARLRGGELFALEELHGGLSGWTDTAAIERAYAQALAFAGHIEHAYGERVVFELVTGCAQGDTPERTFQRRIGLSLDVALADLAQELGAQVSGGH